MADSIARLKESQSCHANLLECATHIEDVINRLRGLYMDGLADEISYIPQAIKHASRTIQGNASEDVNEQIRSGERMIGNTLAVLCQRAS